MIAYRSQDRLAITRELISSLCRQFRAIETNVTPEFDTVQHLLIEFGVFESGLADALTGDRCMPGEETRLARAASLALGRFAYNVLRGRDSSFWCRRFGELLAELTTLMLPPVLPVSVPEGYAFYAVYPAAYIAAAERFNEEKRPLRATVIGVRSIGTSLSAVVAATLEECGCSVRSYTVRPLGHPWDRELHLPDALQRDWHEQRRSEFLIVDEGPGISGSTFSSVAGGIERCGVHPARISFFPSWVPAPGQLKNEKAQARWSMHPRYVANCDLNWTANMQDLSAGKWRESAYYGVQEEYPAVQPQHESPKYYADAGVLVKFSGLGPYGNWKLDRLHSLAGAGYTPAALGFSGGFISTEFVPGRQLKRSSRPANLLDRIAAYLAFRAKNFPARRSVSFETMHAMVELNTREALKREPTYRLSRRVASLFESRPAVEVDGRMMPHEWIQTDRGLLKTDAVDHHADHFFPGCADIAWDIAATWIEFDLRAPERQYLVDRYAALSGDRIPAELLSFYRIAYLAFRTGYASLAAEATSGTLDHERFGALQLGFACLLQRQLAARSRDRMVRAS